MAFAFRKAQRSLSKLRLAIQGPSGSGKTFGALLLAKGIGGKIALIDTERGSASLYSDIEGMPEFDVLDLEAPFTPERYIQAIKMAEQAGYDILIIDSMSHEWQGVGGCLEINDQLARSRYKGNSWAAWSEVTPRHRKFVDVMLASKCHIIATMRSKTDTVQSERNGKKTVEKVGIKAEQRDGMDYEFTIVFDVVPTDHIATTSKDRTALFSEPLVLDENTGKKIAQWLQTAAPEPEPTPEPVPPPPPAQMQRTPVQQQAYQQQPVQQQVPAQQPVQQAPQTAPQVEPLSFEVQVRIDELEQGLLSSQTMEQLNQFAPSINALGLSTNHPAIIRLRQAYATKRSEIVVNAEF